LLRKAYCPRTIFRDLPLIAVQRLGCGRWLLRASVADPFSPAVVAVAALDEPDYAGDAKRSAIILRPFDHTKTLSRGTINNFSWRDDLLQLARLIDTFSPDRDNPEAFCIKKNAVSHELRRLAKWRPAP
jgi:hypothetical protein